LDEPAADFSQPQPFMQPPPPLAQQQAYIVPNQAKGKSPLGIILIVALALVLFAAGFFGVRFLLPAILGSSTQSGITYFDDSAGRRNANSSDDIFRDISDITGFDIFEAPADPVPNFPFATAEPDFIIQDDYFSGFSGEKEDLWVWSFTDEIPNAIARYQEMNPDSIVNNFNIVPTILTDWDGSYEQAIEAALIAGNNPPDIFMAEQAFILKFSQGDFSSFAATYSELGIQNVERKIADAGLAQYAVNAGRRNGEVVGLNFQETGSCFIYRRSIAREVFGTDDPAEIGMRVGPGWNMFMDAAAQVKAHGYAMVFGDEDIWQVARNGATQPWVVDGYLYIDPARLSYFDLAKQLYDNGYMIGGGAWNDGWFAGMAGTTEPAVFSYMGPAWLINYTMTSMAAGNPSDGDWAVTTSPVPWAWGGTWLFGHRDLQGEKRAAVAEILEWITLDISEDGFQQHWANDTLYAGSELFPHYAAAYERGDITKDTVASSVVMARTDGSVPMLGGQNMFEYFIPAAANVRSDHWHEYDAIINWIFQDYCRYYYRGDLTKEEALDWFRADVYDRLGIPSR
jgi:hypothetical protein